MVFDNDSIISFIWRRCVSSMSWNFCQPMQAIIHNENNFWNAKPYIIIIKCTKQKKTIFFFFPDLYHSDYSI